MSVDPSPEATRAPVPSSQDLELFLALNEEYRDRPLVPRPPAQDPRTYRERAANRAASILNHVPVEGRDVFELGCGHGWLSRTLAEDFGARSVTGVDISPYPAWEADHASRPDVRLVAADIAATKVVEPGSIDTIVSTAVFEHVHRPVETLGSLATMLRDGGVAWLYFNLHRGPKASHRYREVFFPWPHLLFEPEVGSAYYLEQHGVRRTWSWVNRMTVGNYLDTFRELGLTVKYLRRSVTPIDVSLYRRFEDRLGRYPVLDLETDFMTVVLEKGGDGTVPPAGYLMRERAFRKQLAAADAAAVAAAAAPEVEVEAAAAVPVPEVAVEAAAPAAEVEPAEPEAEPVVEAEPEAEAEPMVEAEPVAVAEVEAEPVAEAEPAEPDPEPAGLDTEVELETESAEPPAGA